MLPLDAQAMVGRYRSYKVGLERNIRRMETLKALPNFKKPLAG